MNLQISPASAQSHKPRIPDPLNQLYCSKSYAMASGNTGLYSSQFYVWTRNWFRRSRTL